MSPILFDIYINGLAEEIQKARLGVKIIKYRNGKLGILMFADDIALIAETPTRLQKIMDITYQYSLKWRFTFNYDKCAVMIFDRSNVKEEELKYGNCKTECTCGYHWRLGEQLIKQVNVYKYLGIELDVKLQFATFKTCLFFY